VLRNASRHMEAGSLPAPAPAPAGASAAERADALACAHSHPTWLVERWLRRWGDADTAQLLACNNACAARRRPWRQTERVSLGRACTGCL